MKCRITSISLTSGKSFDAFANVGRAQCGARVHSRHVERRKLDAALAGRRLFEDQPFVLADVAPRFFDAIGQLGSPQTGFDRIRRSAAVMRSISARVVVSVTQNSARLVSSG